MALAPAPSPHDQLWRWKIAGWITEASSTVAGTGFVRKAGDTMSGQLTITSGGLKVDADGISVTGISAFAGSLLPSLNNTFNLGSPTLRWATVYTGDLSLKNDVGDWLIVEGEEDLFITNNKTGKRYKFALIPVDED